MSQTLQCPTEKLSHSIRKGNKIKFAEFCYNPHFVDIFTMDVLTAEVIPKQSLRSDQNYFLDNSSELQIDDE